MSTRTNRYLLFGYNTYYPHGGVEDVITQVPTLDAPAAPWMRFLDPDVTL